MMRLGRGQQRGGVRPDGEEGDIPKVEQSGQADHDVQAKTQKNVDANGAQRVVPVLSQNERQDQHQYHDQGIEPVAAEPIRKDSLDGGALPERGPVAVPASSEGLAPGPASEA